MAGAGFKTFNTGDVLTASDVNTYLMQQTVMVFADASARSTALGANVAEGMLSYLKDTNAVEVYNGSAWVSSDDPNAIQNTIVDAKGDLISATAADTPARLAVGTNGQVLTADSSTATGLKWATPTTSSWTRVANGTLSGSSISITSISAAEILISLSSFSQDTSSRPSIRCNNDSTAGTYGVQNNEDFTEIRMNGSSSTSGEGFCYIVGANSSAIIKMAVANLYPSYIKISSSITSVQIISGGTFTGGTYEVWTR